MHASYLQGAEALRQGVHEAVEHAYQKTKNFERLSFLYVRIQLLSFRVILPHLSRSRARNPSLRTKITNFERHSCLLSHLEINKENELLGCFMLSIACFIL